MQLLDQLQKHKNWLSFWIISFVIIIIFSLAVPYMISLRAVIQYISIVSCVLYVITFAPNDIRLLLAIILTILADTILMFGGILWLGVLIFCLAQFFHAWRFSDLAFDQMLIHYSVAFILITIFCSISHLEVLYVSTFIYAFCLLSSVAYSYIWYKKDNSNIPAKFAFVGMLLFLGCDINVALTYLAQTGALPNLVMPISNFLIWVFYLLSQVALANSSKIEKIN